MQIDHSPFQDQLVRGLAHRMNNLLTLFYGYLGLLLEDEKLDPATLAGLAQIKEGARCASELITRTQALVRPAKSVWRELDPAALLRDWKPSLEALCPPGITLRLRAGDGLPLVWADAERIRTAVLELVRNAAAAAPQRGGTVCVAASMAEHRPVPMRASLRWLSLTVSDDGPGIAPPIREKIFAPFFSGPAARPDSAGLGLTLALSLVQQHGGILRLKQAGGPTVFEILLPSRSTRP